MEPVDLLKLSGINENYQGRINRAADHVVKSTPRSKEDITDFISAAASLYNDVEKRLGGRAWRDFQKDVVAALKGRLGPMKSQSAIDKKAAGNEQLQRIAYMAQDAAGAVFPDGDPFDVLAPKLQRMGYYGHEIGDVLDKAAKKFLGVKSYHDYLATMWDDVSADNLPYTDKEGRDHPAPLTLGVRNPWR
jgi:hypothetical protein